MTQQKVKTLLTETESLWLAALEARRVAAAKEQEYYEALREWFKAETKPEKEKEQCHIR